MYRGEPIALWTITIGYFFFLTTQIMGYLAVTQPNPTITRAHYYLAFFGWIGLVIYGAELQFFRAITVIRKYTPEYLRHTFLITLVIGLITITIAPISPNPTIIKTIGLILYITGVLIHTFWIAQKKFSRLFKFPLDYYLIAHLFLLFTLFTLLIETATQITIFNDFTYTHILTIGWITITLQGALLRILPFFIGKSIYRPLRPHTTKHLYFTSLASLIFVSGIILTIVPLIILGSLMWAISWVWVIYVLIKSITQKDRKTLHKISLGFFIPGITWFAFGSIFGMLAEQQQTHNIKLLHVHTILVAGLGLIMLGAIHRIVVFQIYSIIYTGRKREKTEESLLQKKPMTYVLLLYNLAVIIFILGFGLEQTIFIAIGGTLLFTASIAFLLVLLPVYIHYLKYKHTALPIHLKKGEDPSTPL